MNTRAASRLVGAFDGTSTHQKRPTVSSWERPFYKTVGLRTTAQCGTRRCEGVGSGLSHVHVFFVLEQAGQEMRAGLRLYFRPT